MLLKGIWKFRNLQILSGSGAPLSLKYADVEITSALILAAYTKEIALVAAPGAGKFIEFVSLTLAYDYGATAYTVGSMGSWRVRYVGSATWQSASVSPTGFIDQTTDQVRISLPPTTSAYTPLVNTGIELVCTAADPTAGDGVIHARVVYRVLETGL